MNLKIVSWNIAGGHKAASLDHFDYQGEELEYFAGEISKLTPNIICLQEAHTKGSKSNATDLSELLDIEVIVNSVNSPSHIQRGYSLSNTIFSSLKHISVEENFYPDPKGELFWKDGTKANTHKKNLQYINFGDFNLANNQMLPVRLFGFSYDDKEGRGPELVEQINDVMSQIVENPVIWCGDFNYENPLRLYSHMKDLQLKDALPDRTTRPAKDNDKKKPDHIFYSPEFSLIEARIIKTKTDHFLCYAELEFETRPI